MRQNKRDSAKNLMASDPRHPLARRLTARVSALALAGAALCFAEPAQATPQESLRLAGQQLGGVNAELSSIEKVAKGRKAKSRTPEQMIADARLLMGVKDFDRAASVLSRVVEKFKDHPTAYGDALRLLGESYYKDEQYLSARRKFEFILANSSDRRLLRYRDWAVRRLIDIALKMKDLKGLERALASIAAAGGSSSPSLAYARGKGLLAQGKLAAAEVELEKVQPTHRFYHQARYLLGLAATRRATAELVEARKTNSKKKAGPSTYVDALKRFRALASTPADNKAKKRVVDLAWLAVGRLLYESGQLKQAVEAYNKIERSSAEFGTMLFELAWVYVRLADFTRAQRALEVHAVTAQDSNDIADAALLRGDLMLRSGRYRPARKVYENVRAKYEGMQKRVDKFLGATTDPAVYFDMLSADRLELLDAGYDLPPVVMNWARAGEDGSTAFSIIDDVSTCQRLIKESNDMIDRLNVVLASPNKIRAVPGVKAAAEAALGLLNGVAQVRMRIGEGLEKTDGDLSPQLAQVRRQRKMLERRLTLAPVSQGDFSRRESQAKRQWNRASQGLQRLELEIDSLQAMINGIRRILQDSSKIGVAHSPQRKEQFRNELNKQRLMVRQHRLQAKQLRRVIEAGRLQVGFGDKRFVEDAEVRRKYAALLWQEVRLSQGGAGGAELAAYARQVAPVLSRADALDKRIERALVAINGQVVKRVAELRSLVRAETQNVVRYSLQLSTLDKEARVLVGAVAMRNFKRARERLRSIVLRADVGIVQEAWEVREEQITRVRTLKVERARNEQRLQEELDEVLDDSADPEEQ